MAGTSILWSPAQYHIISYGVLLGTTTFQSFVGGIVAFRTLPRPQFASLQQATFPIYFAIQTALPLVLAVTFPAERTTISTSPGSLSGVLQEENRWAVLAPLASMLIAGLANWAYLGPATTRCMRERKHQETRDGKKSYDPPPHSLEMQQLNKRFGALHGASTIVNLAGWVAMLTYGFYLGGRVS